MAKIERLVGRLRANGWRYRLHRGSIEITNPRGLETEYSFSVVKESAPEDLPGIPAHF